VRIAFDRDGWDNYLHWRATDAKVLARLNALLVECMHDPLRGTGKPEPLKATLAGWWSRRITGWCTAFAGRGRDRRSRCWRAGIIIEVTP